MNIGALLPRHARYRPDHLAVVFEDHRLTFRQFNARVNRLAHALLAAGLAKGDKVATVLPNCLEQLEVYWAACEDGARGRAHEPAPPGVGPRLRCSPTRIRCW